ncbi:alpha/beta hydrolase [Mycobacterium shimoidei]|nr:alpha/beta hydrolase [Mycobacterium shimoidei]
MQAVGTAIGKSADEVQNVKDALSGIDRDADSWGFKIDRATGTVTPSDSLDMDHPTNQQRQAELEARIKKVLADANAADADLARAITTGGRDATGPAETRPDVRAALSGPLPEDPQQFHDLWDKLSKEEKDWLYSHDHNIGNHPGMPWDPPDHLGRDHYNKLHLPDLQQNAQANVDRLQAQFDALAKQAYMGDHDAAAQASALAPQLAAAKHSLDGYKAVQADLNKNDGVKRYLGFIDDKGHAAVSINNPDTATRNAIFVPGTGQDLAAFNGADTKSRDMYEAALRADPSLKAGDVAVTTWMGYDRPMDVFAARHPDPALGGAGALDSFESGMRASHVGPPSIDTVIGHSYGSTLVGAAASGGHQLDANNVIAVGSPGMLVNDVSGMNLDPGAKVYATLANNDIIGPTGLVTQFTLGPEPVSPGFGATILAAAPGPTTNWGVDAHSSYWAPGNIALANMGSVIAGVEPPQISNIKMSGQ